MGNLNNFKGEAVTFYEADQYLYTETKKQVHTLTTVKNNKTPLQSAHCNLISKTYFDNMSGKSNVKGNIHRIT